MASAVRLVVLDLLGREVAILMHGMVATGAHTVSFEAGALPSGMYIYKLQTPSFTDIQKMILLK